MPFASIADVPANVKAFWKRLGASDTAKRQWVSVFNSCDKRGLDEGRCIASANAVLKRRLGVNGKEFSTFTINVSLSPEAITEGEVDGTPVWEIPTIFTREGVQNKSFKPWEELLKAEWTLDGAPVTLGHPPGHEPSLMHPEVIIGEVMSHSPNEEDRSLNGSIGIWKDDPRSNWLIEELHLGLHRDGSVGFTTTLDIQSGLYYGEDFINIERDMFFDHFAVGINRGACPAPSCGLLYNMPNDAEHPDDCPEGQHMVDGKCVDIDEDQDTDLQGQCPEGQHHHPNTHECVDDEVLERETTARDTLDAMNIFEDKETLEAAVFIFGDEVTECHDCQTELSAHEDRLIGDQTYTFNPAWSEVDKTKLPSSAYMIVRDSEKRSTWKLPFKNPGGSINCNAIRAIVSVLGGARGGVDLTADERKKVRAAAARHQRNCLAARQDEERAKTILESDALKKVLYTAGDINVSENRMSDEGNPADEDSNQPAAEPIITDESLRLKVDELEIALKKTNDELAEFKEDAKERTESEVKDLRRAVHNAVDDPEVYSYNEIEAMSKEELLVARRLLDSGAPADRGASVSTGRNVDVGDGGIEYKHGQAFSKTTIGELYEAPKLNLRDEREGGK